MNTYNITIPKSLAQMGDLVLVSSQEYKKYKSFWEFSKIREFVPTLAEKRALKRAEKNLKNGKTLSYDELIRKLGVKN